MASALIMLSAIFLSVAVSAADASQPVSEVCMRCICQAVSGCKPGILCEGHHCGMYSISWAYWADAGKPTINGQSSDANDAYPNCSNDANCAALTVQEYMNRFGRDCNGDGRVDCYDYMAMHKKGWYSCAGELPNDNYVNVFNQCMQSPQTRTEIKIRIDLGVTI